MVIVTGDWWWRERASRTERRGVGWATRPGDSPIEAKPSPSRAAPGPVPGARSSGQRSAPLIIVALLGSPAGPRDGRDRGAADRVTCLPRRASRPAVLLLGPGQRRAGTPVHTASAACTAFLALRSPLLAPGPSPVLPRFSKLPRSEDARPNQSEQSRPRARFRGEGPRDREAILDAKPGISRIDIRRSVEAVVDRHVQGARVVHRGQAPCGHVTSPRLRKRGLRFRNPPPGA